MRRQPIVGLATSLALGGLALSLALGGCEDLPSVPTIPDDVASVQIENSCSFIPVEETCVITARAVSVTGLVMSAPRLT